MRAGRRFRRAVVALSTMLFFCPVILRTGGSPASKLPRYTYTGVSTLIDDGDGNWRIKFLSSGTLCFNRAGTLDVFLVGGGAGGGYGGGNRRYGGGGGFAGTYRSIGMLADVNYAVVVGAGGASSANGGSSSAFGLAVSGGYGDGTANNGGGSGGGAGSAWSAYAAGAGGSNGAYGGSCYINAGGTGQGSTTREFGSASGTLYSGGGGGGAYDATGIAGAGGAGGGGNGANPGGTPAAGATNTGGGGGGSYISGSGAGGGSGIVVIRNHRTDA